MTEDKPKNHYVNNKDFSLAVQEYVEKVQAAQASGEPTPEVPNYLAECFVDISKNLSNIPNFRRYSYIEEMIMDAVENCLKAVSNYDISKTTRTGSPNAFAYFTQICYWAFVRRIQKEKKQQDIKNKYMMQAPIEDFIHHDEKDGYDIDTSYIEQLRSRIERVKETDQKIKEFAKEEKARGVEHFMK